MISKPVSSAILARLPAALAAAIAMVGMATSPTNAHAQSSRGATPQSEALAALSKAQFAARPERHERYYGPTDNRVAASPALHAVASEIRARLPRGQWDQAGVDALRRHILADGRIDDDERDLIVEVTFDGPIRTIMVSPAGPAAATGNRDLLMTEVVNDAMRTSLAAMLDVEPLVPAWDANWTERQRDDALNRLATASMASRDHARNLHALLLEEAKPRALASNLGNTFTPLRELISQTYAVIKTFPDESDKVLLRHILHDAVFDAVVHAGYATGEILPDYLYSWIRPK